MPIDVKKATESTVCVLVSSCTESSNCRAMVVNSVNRRPPMTAAGMFSRSSHPTRFLSAIPMKYTTAASDSVWSRSSVRVVIDAKVDGAMDAQKKGALCAPSRFHDRLDSKSGRPDSNRRRPAWEAGILPTELRPRYHEDTRVNACQLRLKRLAGLAPAEGRVPILRDAALRL